MNESGGDAASARDLVLYATDSCTLCDEALELLLSMPELSGWSLRVVDVADDDGLLADYGERLPVVGFQGIELDWPFTRDQLARRLR